MRGQTKTDGNIKEELTIKKNAVSVKRYSIPKYSIPVQDVKD